MIVISDTTAISTFLQIGELEMLERLFQEVVIPAKVYDELQVLSNFGVDISPLQNAAWLRVKMPSRSPLLTLLENSLDPGEANAIALAVELKADLLLMDEARGRKVAHSMNLPFTGVGGVLIRAKDAGLIASVTSFLDLIGRKTNFYLSQKARAIILKAAGE